MDSIPLTVIEREKLIDFIDRKIAEVTKNES